YIEVIASREKLLRESNMSNDVSRLGSRPGHRTVRVPARHGIDPENCAPTGPGWSIRRDRRFLGEQANCPPAGLKWQALPRRWTGGENGWAAVWQRPGPVPPRDMCLP